MIHNRLCRAGLGLGLFLALLAGCGKSDSPAPGGVSPSALSSQLSTPSLRLHWLGKKQLAAETNAASFLAIWNLPESAALEAQTLDKLATAPWRLLKATTPLSNAPTALLRPLLDDLVQAESYWELTTASNQAPELVLALRLSPDRAALWQTNLPAILQSILPTSDLGFQLSTINYQLTITRSNNWTLLSLSPTQLSTSNSQLSPLLSDFHRRLAKASTPSAPRATNYWLTVDAEIAALTKLLPGTATLAAGLSRLGLTAIGDGANVRTHGDVFFSKPLPIEFNAWNIPTNLISDQLISFTALRLPDAPQFKAAFGLDLTECVAQRQIFVWALRTLPMATYVAAPVASGSGCYERLTQWLLNDANAWISNNAVGAFAVSEAGNSVVWQGAPFMSAYAQSVKSSSGDFVLAGFVPSALTNRAPTSELVDRISQRPQLVFYDWEFTGPRVESWFYIGQLGRVVSGRQQMAQDSQGIAWLKAAGPKLGNAGTVAELPGPQQLSFNRFSTLGLTAVELHVLMDWLESPDFPKNTHTTAVPSKPFFRRNPGPPVPSN